MCQIAHVDAGVSITDNRLEINGKGVMHDCVSPGCVWRVYVKLSLGAHTMNAAAASGGELPTSG